MARGHQSPAGLGHGGGLDRDLGARRPQAGPAGRRRATPPRAAASRGRGLPAPPGRPAGARGAWAPPGPTGGSLDGRRHVRRILRRSARRSPTRAAGCGGWRRARPISQASSALRCRRGRQAGGEPRRRAGQLGVGTGATTVQLGGPEVEAEVGVVDLDLPPPAERQVGAGEHPRRGLRPKPRPHTASGVGLPQGLQPGDRVGQIRHLLGGGPAGTRPRCRPPGPRARPRTGR